MTTVGIDLGTTNSVVAWHDGMRAQFIESSGGHILMPSVVAEQADGTFLVGHQAQKQIRQARNPEYVYSNIKRHIGMAYNDAEDYGPQIVNENGRRALRGQVRNYTPEELSAQILMSLKASAERRLGKKVDGAVISVPAYFDNLRVDATIDAAIIAGFKKNKIKIKTEPEMAGKAYGVSKGKFTRIVVFDFGGGTFDVVLLEAGLGDVKIIQKDGWDQLGGVDFDEDIKSWLIERYMEEKGKDLSSQQISLLKLGPVTEEAKCDLTDSDTTLIEVQSVFYDHDSGATMDLSCTLGRDEFNALTQRHVAKAMEICARVLERADWTVRTVDEVLLVGGMTRVPAVREAVGKMFGTKKLRDTISPDLAVAEGAAIAAAEEDGRLIAVGKVSDITAQAFGLAGPHDQFLPVLPNAVSYGHMRSLIISTMEDGQTVIPIAVLQGNTKRATECAVLARYDHRVQPGLAGTPRIEIEFMVDDNGQLIVAGKDQDTGQSLSILEP